MASAKCLAPFWIFDLMGSLFISATLDDFKEYERSVTMWARPFGFIRHFIVAVVLGIWAFNAPSQVPSRVDFRRDVRPLLKQYCIDCHGPSQQMHGFRLDRRRDAMRGGTITVIAPGASSGSRLYQKLIGNQFGPQMPPTGPLSQEQINIIKAWIDQGAEWPDDLSGDMPQLPPDPKATRIMETLRDGDKQTFKKLVGENPGIGSLKGPGGTTPLMQAVLYADSDSVRTLLAAGADPNIRNEAGATALMWAVSDREKTRLLLDRGADVNARSDDGRTPLLIASGQYGSSAVVGLLLDHGAKLTARSPSIMGYMTPLTEAASVGDDALLRTLIERGADVKSEGLPALLFAAKAKCGKCLETLIAHVDRGALSVAALLCAPPLGDATAVKALLTAGADAKATDPGGHTLLMLAASSDALPTETLKAILEGGADVSAKCPEGLTALDFAKQRGATSIVDLLSKAGAKDGAVSTNPTLSPKPAKSVREALQRSIPLLQKTDSIFIQKSGCVSCHNNTLTALTIDTARKNRFPVDEQIARGQLKRISSYIETWRERSLQGVGIPGGSDTMGYILLGLAAENYPPDPATDGFARYIKSQQSPDGGWRVFAHRPPIESSDIQVTATSLRSLQVYAPKARRTEYETAVRRAAEWLMKAQPLTTEERAFQLLGLGWAGVNAKNAIIRSATRDLLAQQRSDGGWAQLPSLASDAYATGQALVALREAGAVPPTDEVYNRGVAFLLRTQLDDGSWYVRSRAIPIQPFFESGFPHGHDQWISAAATNWAAMALALTAGR